jgi:hypothetical protein
MVSTLMQENACDALHLHWDAARTMPSMRQRFKIAFAMPDITEHTAQIAGCVRSPRH